MICEKFESRLHDYCDGLLAPAEQRMIEEHLATCVDCRSEVAFLNTLRQQVAGLPKNLHPPQDLWPAIAPRLSSPKSTWASAVQGFKNIFSLKNFEIGNDLIWGWRGALALALLLLIGGGWFFVQMRQSTWAVAPLAGAPQIGSRRLVTNGQLQVGEWLETDASSRAKLNVGMIGHVELAPQTRIRLLKTRLTDHRLALARGKIHAEIWAPPRLFFVETPSALATDLGCEYTLEMDEQGYGQLYVLKGYVALENKSGPESVVPAGAFCEIQPQHGPGTPYSENSSPALRTALRRSDFAGGGSEALNLILTEAREADTFTLWHLLFRVVPIDRNRVYDRMAELISPPPGVTRAGVLQGDQRMLKLWADKFGLGQSWARYWLPL